MRGGSDVVTGRRGVHERDLHHEDMGVIATVEMRA